MNVLQTSFAVAWYIEAEIRLHPLLPRGWDVGYFQLSGDEPSFEVNAQHDMKVVGQLVGFGPNETRRCCVDGGMEAVRIHIAERIREGRLHRREMEPPEGTAPTDMVLPEARLRFVRAETRSTHGVQTDEVGREGGAGQRRVDILLVEAVASLMHGTEESRRQIIAPIARRDPHVLPRE